MPKRIYLLAKELDKSNKEILEALADLGIDKNSPSQNLTDQEEAQVVSYIELMAHAVISAPPPEHPKEEKIDKPEPKAAPKAVTAKARRNPFILSDVDEAPGKPNPFLPKDGPAPGKPNPFRPKDGERPVPPGVAHFLPKGDDGDDKVNPFLPKDVD